MMTHQRRALYLSYFTVLYNILEGLVAVGSGVLMGSPALTGFGIDSFVESISGGIMIWRFWNHDKLTHAEEERIEHQAVKLIAYSLFVLGTYVAYESFLKIYLQEPPEKNMIGVMIAVVSLLVMPGLFIYKHRTAKSLKSRSLIADAKQTLACMMMSVALLVGMLLYNWFEWWQADPMAGIVIAGFLIREGRLTLKANAVCNC